MNCRFAEFVDGNSSCVCANRSSIEIESRYYIIGTTFLDSVHKMKMSIWVSLVHHLGCNAMLYLEYVSFRKSFKLKVYIKFQLILDIYKRLQKKEVLRLYVCRYVYRISLIWLKQFGCSFQKSISFKLATETIKRTY